jgi:hypothetical protein
MERTPNADSAGQAPDTRRPTGRWHVPAVSGDTTNWLSGAFYVVVLAVAWVGQFLAAVNWLGVHWFVAALAVSALELGGVALAARADYRRRLNETAIGARLLSAGVAGFAVAFNWLGHSEDRRQALFFAGMSALGYLVWLLNSGDRRRDQLRAEGKLPSPPPSYERWQWVKEPLVTWRARAMAKADPALGTYGSLAAARAAIRVERRTRSISKVLRRKLTAAVDPTTADIAVNVYDLDEIAVRLAGQADYDHLTALVAADLTPDKLTTGRADSNAGTKVKVTSDSTAEVVDLHEAGRRRRVEPDSLRKPKPATAGMPSVQDLADTLTAVHGDSYVGTPQAQKTLRARYGTCSKDRAIEAKTIHNARRQSQTSGGESADDPKEQDHELVHAAG